MKEQKKSSSAKPTTVKKIEETVSSITDVIQKNGNKRGRKGRNLLLASTAIGAVGYGAWQAGRTRFNSKISGSFNLKGMSAPAEVIRDKWGIPHIYAQNLSDLVFVQGFVVAQDRFWQMEFQRRLASGRLAEVLGDQVVEIDKSLRRLQLRNAAHNDYAALDPDCEEKMIIDRYADGVNAFLAHNKLPIEFSILRYKPEPWSAVDSLTWAKIIAVQQSTNLDSELVRARMVQKVGAERAAKLEPTQVLTGEPMIVPPDANYSGIDFDKILEEYLKMKAAIGSLAGGASNNWVLSGNLTESGKPILCNDPHMSIMMPSTWYEVHLNAGDFDVIGVALPGIPLISIGHNRYITWGITNTMADFQDSFIEKVDPTNPNRYEYKGEWKEFETTREEIKVKGKPSVFAEYARSVHGPVLNSIKLEGDPAADAGSPAEAPVCVSWNIYEPSKGFSAIIKLCRARNWQDFREALSHWDVGSFSFVFADVEGNIGYQFTGRIPIRGKGIGLVPSPGHTGEYDWQGYIPFEELPYLFNPETGYAITTNQKVVDNDYPYWLGSDYLGENRAKRIRELLTSKEKFTLDDMARFQQDLQCIPGLKLTRRITSMNLSKAEETVRRAVGYMATWDGQLTAQSVAGCLYEVTLQKLSRLIVEPILGEVTESYLGNATDVLGPRSTSLQSLTTSFLIDKVVTGDKDLLPAGKNWDEVLLEALIQAIKWLKQKLGDDMNGWEWGKLHTITYAHPLGAVKPLNRIFNRGPFPLGGDWDTVWQAGYNSTNDSYTFNGASSALRLIADLDDWERTRFCCTSGQSGTPFSPHYADFIEDWLGGDYHPHLFNRVAILENAEGKLTINPA